MFAQLGDVLSPPTALSLLTAQAPELCAPYLEVSLENGVASHEEFDHELASIYLRAALDAKENDDQGDSVAAARTLPNTPSTSEGIAKLKELVGIHIPHRASVFGHPIARSPPTADHISVIHSCAIQQTLCKAKSRHKHSWTCQGCADQFMLTSRGGEGLMRLSGDSCI